MVNSVDIERETGASGRQAGVGRRGIVAELIKREAGVVGAFFQRRGCVAGQSAGAGGGFYDHVHRVARDGNGTERSRRDRYSAEKQAETPKFKIQTPSKIQIPNS